MVPNNNNPTLLLKWSLARSYDVIKQLLTSFLFLTAVPNTMARMGPMSGDTSMLATSTTLEFSTSPMKARHAATTSRHT